MKNKLKNLVKTLPFIKHHFIAHQKLFISYNHIRQEKDNLIEKIKLLKKELSDLKDKYKILEDSKKQIEKELQEIQIERDHLIEENQSVHFDRKKLRIEHYINRFKTSPDSIINKSNWLSINFDKEITPSQFSVDKIGGGDFWVIGTEFFQYFVRLGGLQPASIFLDVGCGIGRMAAPLTQYLISPDGQYFGFDIDKKGIQWCQQNITKKFPNFQFQTVDVINPYYNPTGKIKACDFVFPYQENFFDFVFLGSVFTHMLPNDLKNYLFQIKHVLKRGGMCFITYFLLNDRTKNFSRNIKSTYKFKNKHEGYYSNFEENHEAAIAYEEADILKLYKETGLIIKSTHYGSWCVPPIEECLSYQDIITAQK